MLQYVRKYMCFVREMYVESKTLVSIIRPEKICRRDYKKTSSLFSSQGTILLCTGKCNVSYHVCEYNEMINTLKFH